jgi:hypothetical protein
MAVMALGEKVRTLYDDWQARRERLAAAAGKEGDYRAVEMRLLDFLLRRYHASPEAARPARFPLPTSLFVNHRAIVVHHHLGRGVIPTISNQQEAYAHVRSIVERMKMPAPPADAAVPDDEIAAFAVPPEDDPVEVLRINLCNANPVVRVRAAIELGQSGELDDIGLLSDLLSLPVGPDEHPQERPALLWAMRRLSGETVEEFDLSGVLLSTWPPAAAHARDAGRNELLAQSLLNRLAFVLALLFLVALLFGVLLLSRLFSP